MAEIKAFGFTFNTDRLKELPDMYKIIAGGVVAGVILAAGGFYLVYPVYTEYTVLLEENDKLQQDNEAMETKLGYNATTNRYRKIDAVEAEMKVLEDEIKVVQTRIPTEPGIPVLVYDLERIVEDKNKTDLFDIVPAAAQNVTLPAELNKNKPKDMNLQQVPVALTMESNYPTLINLFKDFERYERAVSISNLSLAPVGESGNKFSDLKVTTNMKAFLLPEGKK